MPTRAAFEAAADKLDAAARQVDDLTVAAQEIDVARVLHGGSLSVDIPRRIAASVDMAMTCRTLITQARELCLERAAIIAEYEKLVEAYFVSYQAYSHALDAYIERMIAFDDGRGTGSPPGTQPLPPDKPPPPPPWADVVRL